MEKDRIELDIEKVNKCLDLVDKNIESIKKILNSISDYCMKDCQNMVISLKHKIESYKARLQIKVTDSEYTQIKEEIGNDILKDIKFFNNLNLKIKENYEKITQINKDSNSYILQYFGEDTSTLMANNTSSINDSEVNININENNNITNESLYYSLQNKEKTKNIYSDESYSNKDNDIMIDNNNNKNENEYQKLKNQNKEITEKFLNSFNFVIKSIILKTNYLLKNEREKQDKDHRDLIIRNADYPILESKEDLWSDKLFIESINKKLEKILKLKNKMK